DASARSNLALGLAAVARRLAPADAAQLLANALGREVGAFARRSLAEGLATVAGSLDWAEAARVCGPAARLLADDLESEHPDEWELFRLSEGLTAVVGYIDRDDAARICRRSLLSVRRALLDQQHAPSKEADYVALSILLGLLNVDEAQQFARDLARQINSQTDSPNIERTFADALDRVLLMTGPSQLRRRAIDVASAAGGQGFAPFAAVPSDMVAAEPLRCRLSTQDLVDLLKMPTCYGEVRKVVLQHLGNRYGRRFADHWEFVEYAQQHDLKLDFTTPPVRYRGP